MASRAPVVHPRCRHTPVVVTALQHLQHVTRGRNVDAAGPAQDEVLPGLPDRHLGPLRQQVRHLFAVDLHVHGLDGPRVRLGPTGAGRADALEQVLAQPRHNALGASHNLVVLVRRAHHRVRLTAPGLPVGQHRAVEALQGVVEEGGAEKPVHVGLVNGGRPVQRRLPVDGPEGVVHCELLLLTIDLNKFLGGVHMHTGKSTCSGFLLIHGSNSYRYPNFFKFFRVTIIIVVCPCG